MDKLTVTAAIDRIIYGDPKFFLIEDAKLLAEVVPRQKRSWFGMSLKGKSTGGKSAGHAAGVGNVSLDDDPKEFKAEVGGNKFTRIGQYKIRHFKDGIEIWKMMADPFDPNAHAALLEYEKNGEPKSLKSFSPRSIVIPIPYCRISFLIDDWAAWKTPR